MTRRLTIIESPYADNKETGVTIAEHLVYLRRCLRHSWEQGELPFASHGFFPLFLHESDPAERKAGIEAGYEFWNLLHDNAYQYMDELAKRSERPVIAFYCDYGISPGMKLALERVQRTKHNFVIRNILGTTNAK